MSKPDFRPYVPKMGEAHHYGMDVESFVASWARERVERRRNGLAKMLATPFKGITADGEIVPGLFSIRPEGAPTAAVAAAATAFLDAMTPEQRATTCLPMNARERHAWQNGIANPEGWGLRLMTASPAVREAGMAVVRASLSAKGFEKTRNAMRLNGFLGDLVGAPELMSEWSYFLQIHGEPSTSEPWGWQLTGHHLCVTCFMLGEQMTLTPTFMGAEPRFADEGRFLGAALFDDEERDGLKFVRSLTAAQQKIAILYDTIDPAGLPPGRHAFPDAMTLGGAYQDNRVIPYEGITGADLDARQRRALLDLAECYLASLPADPLKARMEDVERHLKETRFCWAGGLEEDSVFYYRIQSPIVMIEFDHHAGVVLANEKPQQFHVHTIVRTPNGNDYGMDLLRLHYENSPHHQHHHAHDHG